MADIVDQAEKYHEETLANALALNAKAVKALQPTGRCHFCDEEVEPRLRYCDSDCRDLAERHHAAKVRNGG